MLWFSISLHSTSTCIRMLPRFSSLFPFFPAASFTKRKQMKINLSTSSCCIKCASERERHFIWIYLVWYEKHKKKGFVRLRDYRKIEFHSSHEKRVRTAMFFMCAHFYFYFIFRQHTKIIWNNHKCIKKLFTLRTALSQALYFLLSQSMHGRKIEFKFDWSWLREIVGGRRLSYAKTSILCSEEFFEDDKE